MNQRHKQKGISFLGLVFILILLAFVGLFGLKLFPIYMESFKIDKAMKGVLELPNVSSMSRGQIEKALMKRMDIDSVTTIYHRNFKEHVKVATSNGQVQIDVTYDRETPLFMNIYLLVDFEKHQEN